MLAVLAAGVSAGRVTRRGSAGGPAGSGNSPASGSSAVSGPDRSMDSSVSSSGRSGNSGGLASLFVGLTSSGGLGEDVAAFFRRRRFSLDPRTGVKPSLEAVSGVSGAVGLSAAAGGVAPGGVLMFFFGLGAAGLASGAASPWARGVFSGDFTSCMVAGDSSVGLVLKPFILLYLILRGFSTSWGSDEIRKVSQNNSEWDYNPDGVGRNRRDSFGILQLSHAATEKEIKVQYR